MNDFDKYLLPWEVEMVYGTRGIQYADYYSFDLHRRLIIRLFSQASAGKMHNMYIIFPGKPIVDGGYRDLFDNNQKTLQEAINICEEVLLRLGYEFITEERAEALKLLL